MPVMLRLHVRELAPIDAIASDDNQLLAYSDFEPLAPWPSELVFQQDNKVPAGMGPRKRRLLQDTEADNAKPTYTKTTVTTQAATNHQLTGFCSI